MPAHLKVYEGIMVWLRLVCVLLLSLSLTACASTSRSTNTPATGNASFKPRELPNAGPYRHRYLGVTIPVSSGSMVRTNMIQFDANASDIGANYKATGRKLFGTVYIYPIVDDVTALPANFTISPAESDQQCKRFFDGAQSLALKQYANSVVRASGPFSLPQRPGYTGFRLMFDADHRIDAPGYQSALDESDGPLTSELYLFCEQGSYWQLKYRVTYERGLDAQAAIVEWLALVPEK